MNNMLKSLALFFILAVARAQNLLFEPLTNIPKPCCNPDQTFEVIMGYFGATMKAGNADEILVSIPSSIYYHPCAHYSVARII